MPDIVLCTLNARYAHTAFGIRYLRANLSELREQSAILEFEASRHPLDVATAIIEQNPRIVGLSVYIWNIAPLTQVASILKRLRPGLCLVAGGPEVSHETADLEISRVVDHVITGEADLAFAELCRDILERGRMPPALIHAGAPDLAGLRLPDREYTDDDLAHRIVYVEASRGCPYECEFCLSALDIPVRTFPLDAFLQSLENLLARGAKSFKFVDRTFNLDIKVSSAILDFLADRYVPGMFLHFELIPDRLPDALKQRILRFPPGAIQFEIGIQSFDEAVNARISRRQHRGRTEENLKWLKNETGVHLHTDLIVGLPGDDLSGFGRSFDALYALAPHEIQIGILKRLRGTPIIRHDQAFGMVWNPFPPYEILETRAFPASDLARMRRFARFFDLYVNSGQFQETAPLLLHSGASPFHTFLEFSDSLHSHLGQSFGHSLLRQATLLYDFLVEQKRMEPGVIGPRLAKDWTRLSRSEKPAFLAPWLPSKASPEKKSESHRGRSGQERQDRRQDTGP